MRLQAVLRRPRTMPLWKLAASVMSTAMVLALAGCDLDDATSPEPAKQTVAPNHDFQWNSNRGNVRLVRGPTWMLEMSNSAVIGAEGGKVTLGLHELVVPRNAVTRATRFTMQTQYGTQFIVDLNAQDVQSGKPVTQFKHAVQLKLSYWMLPLPPGQASKLVVVWLKDGSPLGEYEPVRTTHSPREHFVIGWLNHFSAYAMGLED